MMQKGEIPVPLMHHMGCRKAEAQCVFLLVGIRRGILPIKPHTETT